MISYEVDYSMLMPEYGVLNIEAKNPDDAEMRAIKQLTKDTPDAKEVQVEMVREIVRVP